MSDASTIGIPCLVPEYGTRTFARAGNGYSWVYLEDGPTHLVDGTQRQNMADARERGRLGGWARNAYKTHCIRGHEFTEENTYRYVNIRGNPARRCRSCRKITG